MSGRRFFSYGCALGLAQALAGCGGGSSHIAPPVLNQSRLTDSQNASQESWMDPKAKRGALLYVTETLTNTETR